MKKSKTYRSLRTHKKKFNLFFAQLLWRDIQTHINAWTNRPTFQQIGLNDLEDICKLQRQKKNYLIFPRADF